MHINNLGWFVATYLVNEYPYHKKIFEIDQFKRDISKYSLMFMVLEAKYDLEIDGYYLPENMFHVTPSKHEEKIGKIGLVPKSQSKISKHPERIYLTKTEKEAESLADIFAVDENDKDFVIYSVDMKELIESNNGIRFFQDPNLGGGIYTLSNIPKKFLSVVKRIKIS